MSWEHKLLHCGPHMDGGDLLAHYLFISVLHVGLPRESYQAQCIAAQTDPEIWTQLPDEQMYAAENTNLKSSYRLLN